MLTRKIFLVRKLSPNPVQFRNLVLTGFVVDRCTPRGLPPRAADDDGRSIQPRGRRRDVQGGADQERNV